MDISKFINENIDDILDNTEKYVEPKKNKIKSVKKTVSWKEENEMNSKLEDYQNEDEMTNEEIQEELFQDYYDKKLQKDYLKSIGEEVPDSDDEKTTEELEVELSEHRLKLLNLFLIHYNEKYEKKENYFSNVKNIEKDTSNSMELFFESIVEFKKIKELLNLEEDEECFDYYFDNEDSENVSKLFEKITEGQIYCLDYNRKQIITPCILSCLNYLINNKKDLFGDKDWFIFNLRDN